MAADPQNAAAATGRPRPSEIQDVLGAEQLTPPPQLVAAYAAPDGNQWQSGPATEDSTVVSAPVRPLGPAGEYTAAYRVVSADGHPMQGAVRFTSPPRARVPRLHRPRTRTGPTAPRPSPDTGSVGTPVWPWLAGAGALLVAGVVMALRARRTRG